MKTHRRLRLPAAFGLSFILLSICGLIASHFLPLSTSAQDETYYFSLLFGFMGLIGVLAALRKT